MGPVRTCIGCRSRAPVAELVRTVRRADGCVVVDRAGDGRGAWLCRQSGDGSIRPACVELAIRRQAFERALRAPVSAASVGALRATASERARMEDGTAVDVVHSGRD